MKNKRVTIFEIAWILIIILLGVILIRKANNIQIDLISEEDLHNAQFTEETFNIPKSSQNGRSFEELKDRFITEIEVPDELQPKEALLVKNVEMTFYNPTGNTCKNEEYPIENHTVAFATKYFECECDIYSLDGELIGRYFIDDTGFGRFDHYSEKLKKDIGTIQVEKCVDVFFENETDGREFLAKWGNEVQIVIYEKEE